MDKSGLGSQKKEPSFWQDNRRAILLWIFILTTLAPAALCGCGIQETQRKTAFSKSENSFSQKDSQACPEELPPQEERGQKQGGKKLKIIATLFPQYDFARALAGEKAEVVLLLPPGMESHSFEPTPKDMIKIQESDIFLYTGDAMEPWAAGIRDNLSEDTVAADLSQGITLAKEEEDTKDSRGESQSGHSHEYNPHIWTSPPLAMQMVKNIEKALIQADPSNKDYYQAQTGTYLQKLQGLDDTFRQIVSCAPRRHIFIGSRFSLYYFVEEYGLSYTAAYDSCEEEAEPSVRRVLSMIRKIREEKANAIYYEELAEPYVAETIAEASGAQPLLFHSCHNVSKEDLENGATYLSLMEQNAKNLEKGLKK